LHRNGSQNFVFRQPKVQVQEFQPDSKEARAERHGNPNWGQPEASGPVANTATSFEIIVRQSNLRLDEFITSIRLREWARFFQEGGVTYLFDGLVSGVAFFLHCGR
jgi:hypothetical protein